MRMKWIAGIVLAACPALADPVAQNHVYPTFDACVEATTSMVAAVQAKGALVSMLSNSRAEQIWMARVSSGNGSVLMTCQRGHQQIVKIR